MGEAILKKTPFGKLPSVHRDKLSFHPNLKTNKKQGMGVGISQDFVGNVRNDIGDEKSLRFIHFRLIVSPLFNSSHIQHSQENSQLF